MHASDGHFTLYFPEFYMERREDSYAIQQKLYGKLGHRYQKSVVTDFETVLYLEGTLIIQNGIRP